MEEKNGVRWGNLIDDSEKTRRWFMGNFPTNDPDNQPPPTLMNGVSAKFDICQAGLSRSKEQASADPENDTLQILVGQGKVITTLVFSGTNGEEELPITLEKPGDYCFWPTGTKHYWEIPEDSTVMTLRGTPPEASDS